MHDYNPCRRTRARPLRRTSHAGQRRGAVRGRASRAVLRGRGDLRLAALTPPVAVDKGIASLGGMAAPTTDVLGAPRPAGAGYDIGAYEFGLTAPPTGTGGAAGSGGAGGTGGSSGARRIEAAAPAAAAAAAAPAAPAATGAMADRPEARGPPRARQPRLPARPAAAAAAARPARAARLAGCLACNLLAVPGSILVLSRRRRGARRSS